MNFGEYYYGSSLVTHMLEVCHIKAGRLGSGLALTELHRVERLCNLVDHEAKLIKELQNPGHTTWHPSEYPESLLIEVESCIMIRKVQEHPGDMRSPVSVEDEGSIRGRCFWSHV